MLFKKRFWRKTQKLSASYLPLASWVFCQLPIVHCFGSQAAFYLWHELILVFSVLCLQITFHDRPREYCAKGTSTNSLRLSMNMFQTKIQIFIVLLNADLNCTDISNDIAILLCWVTSSVHSKTIYFLLSATDNLETQDSK